MEAGEDAAGHGDEEHGEEVAVSEVGAIVEILAGPGIPHVQQGIVVGEDADEHADGGEHQDRAEDGIDPADDGVDGEHGGDQVVDEDDTVDHPGGHGGGQAVKAEDLSGGDVAGGVHEHGAHQQQQHAQEDVVDREDTLVGVLADHGGHLGAAVTQADHAGEIVVHGAADDVADGNGNERDGPEQDALDGSEDGACACDVQQVDQAVFPTTHGDIIHAVLLGVSGRLPVVGAEDLFAELTIDGSADEKDHQADDKGCHRKHTLLFFDPPVRGVRTK